MKKSNKKLILSIAATGIFSFVGVLIETAMNVAFPYLSNLFHAPLSQIQWITTAYLLALAIMMPLSAYLKRRFLLKQLFMTAAIFFLGGLIIDAFAQNLSLLIFGRILQGVGTGISLPMMFNIILEQAPSKKIGLLMGIGNFITAIAPALGPTYGGVLVDSFGWRAIFYMMIPLLLLAFGLGMLSIQQKTPVSHPNFDVKGWGYLSALLIVLILFFTEINKFNAIIIVYLILTVIFGLAVIHNYQQQKEPILQLSLFKQRNFVIHIIGYFIGQFVVLALSFLLPNLVQIFLGKSSFASGLTMFPGAFVGALLAPIGGILYDHSGAKKPILSGIGFQIISMGLFIFLLNIAGNTGFAIIYILFTIGQSISMSTIMTNGLQMLSVANRADGNALFNTIQQFSGAVGTSIIAAIVAADHSHTQAVGFKCGFLICLLLLLVDVLLFSSRFHQEAKFSKEPLI